ncbi:hypothetical protein TVAG_287410 [Trichomonas vaginalis G3]|uniref:Uncharacterized protein n=1 Tax=Trichomonas vaginalis (strain ATCC PRA-98 / G3) TaxID=412133 RepID=A2GDC9_TRIV3|nr:hypothetical protein TVAGG3_0042720 [Trichomonas vaginalis G3]EAX84837.1 hypothetical protein TVAG_287410 [Trichomonas vaginalis G3]KAI5540807.1 hypothetical protein TVAGG3_0042720 [Trichomonas vaginalis G3]|eukprot:XP_001297767.1 hypothetical protein [Trichomonas vaginalis G3]
MLVDTNAEKWFVIRQLCYANREKDVVGLLNDINPDDPRFMFVSALGIMLLADSQKKNEVQSEFIKSTSMKLFGANRIPDAVTLLTLTGFDKIAVEKLLEINLFNSALPMIRCRVEKQDKYCYVMKIAVKKANDGNYASAAAFFASAGEYHGTLFCLWKLNLITDALVVLEKAEVKEMNSDFASQINNFVALDELVKLIKKYSLF